MVAGVQRRERPLPRLQQDLQDVLEGKRENTVGHVRLKLRGKASAAARHTSSSSKGSGKHANSKRVRVHLKVRLS